MLHFNWRTTRWISAFTLNPTQRELLTLPFLFKACMTGYHSIWAQWGYIKLLFSGGIFFFFFFFDIYAFSRRFYPKRLTIAFRLYILISMCVPWESNPQPFAQLTQCSTTEPHRNIYIVFFILYCIINNVATVIFVLCNESNALKIKDASSYFFSSEQKMYRCIQINRVFMI